MVLLADFFIIFLTVLSVKIPLANWIANILAIMCLIPMPNITELFVIELTVVAVFISVLATLLNVYGRFQE